MKVAIGADHRGVDYKTRIIKYLKSRDIEVIDFGPQKTDSVDYPDYGVKVACAVAEGDADYGITVCGSGNGMAMACNKIKGVRAGLGFTAELAHMTRKHNDANVLSLGADYIPKEQLEEIVAAFLDTEFEGGRHARRVAKIRALL